MYRWLNTAAFPQIRLIEQGEEVFSRVANRKNVKCVGHSEVLVPEGYSLWLVFAADVASERIERVGKRGEQTRKSRSERSDCDSIAGDSGSATASPRFESKLDFCEQHGNRQVFLADSLSSNPRKQNDSARENARRPGRRNDPREGFRSLRLSDLQPFSTPTCFTSIRSCPKRNSTRSSKVCFPSRAFSATSRRSSASSCITTKFSDGR